MNIIGQKIKLLRKLKGLNQVKFAELVGISRTFLSDLERGEKTPSMKTANKISDVLGTSLSSLLTETTQEASASISNDGKIVGHKTLASNYRNEKPSSAKGLTGSAIKFDAALAENPEILNAITALRKFDEHLTEMDKERSLFFRNPYEKIFNDINSGMPVKEVLNNNSELIEIMIEYSKLIKYIDLTRWSAHQRETIKELKEKMKQLALNSQ